MLPISVKATAKVDLATPLRNYLNSKYPPTEVAKYDEHLTQLQSLRNDVATVQHMNEGARESYLKYYVAVRAASEKFQVSESTIKIAFPWCDSLKSQNVISQCSWQYEQACVLFNLAAYESFVAASANRDSSDGIQAASRGFGTAASILVHIKDNIANKLIGTIPYDLTIPGLTMLSNMMLAQSQACYYELARFKNMKPEACSKLAVAGSRLYRSAAGALSEAAFADVDKQFPWSVYANYYTCTFDSAAFWQYSQKARADATAKGDGYGIEIAWLKVAENAARAALGVVTSSKSKHASTVSTASANSLLQQVLARKADAVKDNDTVYFNFVPNAGELPTLPDSTMAKLLPLPDLDSYAESKAGQLFRNILPAEVAASLLELDDMLTVASNEARDAAQKATDEAKNALASMGLPGYLEASEAGSKQGVPDKLWERIRNTQHTYGGLAELDRQFAVNGAASRATREVLQSVAQVLEEESASDAAARARYGERWSATPSSVIQADVQGDLAKYRKVSESADGGDAVVKARLDAARAQLASLSRSRAEIDASIPVVDAAAAASASSQGGGAHSQIRSELRQCIDALQASLDARPSFIREIKEKFDRNTLAQSMIPVMREEHHNLVARAVEAPSEPKRALAENISQQAVILDRIRALHTRYHEVRELDPQVRAREAAIQALSEAVDKFEEIRSLLKQGEQFYQDFRGRTDNLLITARDMASARQLQTRELQLQVREVTATVTAAPGAGGFGPSSASSSGAGGAGGNYVDRMGGMSIGGGGQQQQFQQAYPTMSGGAAASAASTFGAPSNPFDQHFGTSGASAPSSAASMATNNGASSFGGGMPSYAPPQQQQSSGMGQMGMGMGGQMGSQMGGGGGGMPFGQSNSTGSVGSIGSGGGYPSQQFQTPQPGFGAPYNPYSQQQGGGAAVVPPGYPQQQQQQGGMMMNYGQQQQPGSVLSPQAQQLIGMGFDPAKSQRALAMFNNNIEAATAALLDGRV